MNNNKTKYKNTKLSPPLLILYIFFSILLPIVSIYAIVKIYTAPAPSTEEGLLLKILPLSCFILLLGMTISANIGYIIGSLKGKSFINKENKIIKKTNPYIYYRELPNNYGIGVTSLLFDSKIENNKDIIAVILDLCAKKYLSLIKANDKYCIKILRYVDEQLLSNEKYILNLIISQNIKNINYSEWYNYCLQDGNNLGLYYHCEKPKEVINTALMEKETKRLKKIGLLIALFVFIIALIAGRLLEGIWYSIVAADLAIAIPLMVKEGKKETYDSTLNNHLKRTDKGIIELQKLISFQSFLSDFGNFVDKNPEEVILWDRYLSYAQVFGLTKEIMDSGYKQLIDNSSFQIDDINNITIYNIEVEK